jgi:acetyl esterase/lipase
MIYPGPIGIPETVPTNAPPAFLLVANDDRGASGNIVRLLQKYREARVPVEAHIYARGGHGFNMGNRSKLASIGGWRQRVANWLADNNISIRLSRQRMCDDAGDFRAGAVVALSRSRSCFAVSWMRRTAS